VPATIDELADIGFQEKDPFSDPGRKDLSLLSQTIYIRWSKMKVLCNF
jgi:hypothetical protein